MDKDNVKPWERPWTTDQIREHSTNWTLAGDAGLLNHLKQFSKDLLSRTHGTEVALDKLMEDMKTTSLSVQNNMNTFLSLANTQFVENRVYDDDEKETPSEEKRKEGKEVKSKEEQEKETVENIRKALELGMSIMDTHFETVEVSASDSEDEDNSTSINRIILKPKNPYLSRPLPYLIGSREFMEDDSVGLGEVSSDTEGSPDQNIVQFSESDDDSDMIHDDIVVSPKRQTVSLSETENSEPESDRSESFVKQKKMRGNSLSRRAEDEEQEEEERGMFGQESPPESDGVHIAKGGMRSAFSDELASKIGTNKPQLSSQDKDNLFGPSSETEDDSALFGKANHSLSEKQGLFDDIDDWQSTSDSLWNNKTVNKHNKDVESNKQSRNKLFGSGDLDDHQNNVPIDHKKEPKQSIDVSENVEVSTSTPENMTSEVKKYERVDTKEVTGDIFSKKLKDTTSSLFDKDDLDDDLFATPPVVTVSASTSSDTSRKKLPGAVRVFSDVNLFGNISPVVHQESLLDNRNVAHEGSMFQAESSSGIEKTIDIIAQNEVGTESQESHEKSLTFDSQLFRGSSTKIQTDCSNKSSLFQEENVSDSLFDKPKSQDLNKAIIEKNISGAKLFPGQKSKAKKNVSVFDESDSGEDELLFSSTSSTSSRSRRSQGSGDILSNVGEKTLSKKGLFEDSILFGSESKEEPEVDIFQQNGSKTVGNKSNLAGNDLLDGSAKIPSSIFDDIGDDDDIFAVPKPNSEKTQGSKNKFLLDNSEKSFLFNDELSNAESYKKKSNKEEKKEVKLESSNDSFSSRKVAENSQRNASNFLNTLKEQEINQNKKNADKLTNESGNANSVTLPVTASSLLYHQPEKAESRVITPDNNPEDSTKEQNSSDNTVSIVSDSNNPTEVEKTNNNQTSCVKPEPPRSLNIRKTTNLLFESPFNEEDDLFGALSTSKSSSEKDNLSHIEPDNSHSNTSPLGKLLGGLDSSYQSNLTSEVAKEEKNCSPSFNKPINEHIVDMSAKVPSSNVSPSKILSSSPRKLFIDPRALLPGAKPPTILTPTNGAVGFDKPAETSSILHSAGKERIKIQVKRRPQTRKARQEALRASYIEDENVDSAFPAYISNHKNGESQDNVESSDSSSHVDIVSKDKVSSESESAKSLSEGKQTDIDSPNAEEKSDPEVTTGKSDVYKTILPDCLSSGSNPLSPLTDEEDLFAVPHELPSDDTSSKDIPHSPKNLFGGAPVLSPLNNRLESSTIDSATSIFKIFGGDDFLSDESSLKKQNVLSSDTKTEEIPTENSIEKPSTFNISRNLLQKDDLFATSTDNKWLDDKGLFDKTEQSEYFVDDDNLFSSVEKIETKIPDEQSNNTSSEIKSEENRKFSAGEFSGASLFSVSPPHTNDKNDDFLKLPSVSEQKDILSESLNKLSLLNDSNINYESPVNKVRNSLERQDSDDLFSQGGKLKISCDTSSNVSTEKSKSLGNSLFGGNSLETDDLFGSSASSSSKKPIASSNSQLFSESKSKVLKESLFDDSDDDIFTVSVNKPQGQKSMSFFPDDHSAGTETDDLFSKKTVHSKQQILKPSTVQKTQSREALFEDPLMVIKK